MRDGDQAAAFEAVESKTELNNLADKATSHLAKRLVAYEPNRLAAFKLETDFIENMKRVHALTRRIARVVFVEGPINEGPINEGPMVEEANVAGPVAAYRADEHAGGTA
ncbi:MAG TPA: hypothetical protein DDZ51_15635 [Planctomycetaceae bacterium]|nr:hypothetical protein [Planctomycetaceae bacterium]